jgi:predicted CoA-binding protein
VNSLKWIGDRSFKSSFCYMKKTVIVGASTNPGRYAYMAADSLISYKHEIVPIGIKKGTIFGKPILNIVERPAIADVDTVTLYIGPRHQPEWYDYLIGLKPKRIIFNPGTENAEFEKKAEEAGIQTLEACTLVMLRTGQY